MTGVSSCKGCFYTIDSQETKTQVLNIIGISPITFGGVLFDKAYEIVSINEV